MSTLLGRKTSLENAKGMVCSGRQLQLNIKAYVTKFSVFLHFLLGFSNRIILSVETRVHGTKYTWWMRIIYCLLCMWHLHLLQASPKPWLPLVTPLPETHPKSQLNFISTLKCFPFFFLSKVQTYTLHNPIPCCILHPNTSFSGLRF